MKQLWLNARRADRDTARHDHDRRVAIHPKLVNGLRHQSQNAACALELFQRPPTGIKLVEQLRVDRVGLFQLPPVILIRTALRKVVRVFAIKLGKLLQRVVAMVELVARNLLEQPPANDLIALLLACRTPRGFNAAEGLLEAGECFLATFATNLDLRGRQRRDKQGAGAGFNRLSQRLDE